MDDNSQCRREMPSRRKNGRWSMVVDDFKNRDEVEVEVEGESGSLQATTGPSVPELAAD